MSRQTRSLVVVLFLLLGSWCRAQQSTVVPAGPLEPVSNLITPQPKTTDATPVTPEVIPGPSQVFSIDLSTALRIAEAENPTIGIGRQAVQEALAQQERADVLLLPTIQAGASYRNHQGILQTGEGLMRQVDSSSLYAGGGARAVGSATVSIPMVQIFSPLADAFLEPLVARRLVLVRQAQSRATANNTLLSVARRFLELVSAEAELVANRQSEKDMLDVANLTAQFARAGQGRDADARRTLADLYLLQVDILQAEEQVAVASANLAEVLNLDPGIRLKTPLQTTGLITLIPLPCHVQDLVNQAQSARPEIAAASAEVSRIETQVHQEKVRPWLPTISLAVSDGTFGGGTDRTDLVPTNPSFGRFSNRTDIDLMAYWTIQNLGAGNQARWKERQAARDQATQELRRLLNLVRREVISAYSQSEAAQRRVGIARRQLQTATAGYEADLRRIRGGQGLPIELLNSVDRLVTARRTLIRTVLAYNLSQFSLFVALGGQPVPAVLKPGS